MWHNWNTMGFFGWTMMILLWAAIVVLIIWAIRSAGATRSVPRNEAIALLERRFAAGEIDRDEFEEKKHVLE